jgi:hypothetical protein
MKMRMADGGWRIFSGVLLWASLAVGTWAQDTAPKAEEFVGHRFYEEKGSAWGWIKRPQEPWSKALWAVLKEKPGVHETTWRRLGSASADHNHQYKLTGFFENKVAYDPQKDERMAVFVVQGYESLGAAEPPKRKPGSPDRFAKSKKSGASSRRDRPMPDDDSF